MKTTDFTVRSSDNKFGLACCLMEPDDNPKALVVFAHGMAEHKERYYPFMEYLTDSDYACVISDHRGHGDSLDKRMLMGHFDDESGTAIVNDTLSVMEEAKKQFPDIPCFLFSHSMGTLVARCFIQEHDDKIQGLVLSGPPFNNPLAAMGLLMVKFIEKTKGSENKSQFLANLSTGTFDKPFKGEGTNAWLNTSPERVKEYNEDPKCGYMFTADGYRCLFTLMTNAFRKKNFRLKNRNLPIFFVAGSDDPVIGDEFKFQDTVEFLRKVGYKNVSSFLFFSMRHEILNERNNGLVYEEILNFLDNIIG